MNVAVAVIVNQSAVVMVVVRLVRVVVRMAFMHMLVTVAMSVRMCVFVCTDMVAMVVDRHPSRRADPLIEQNRADPHDRNPRNQTQHRDDLLRQHVARKKQGSQPEQKHADGVRKCHHRAEKDGMARRTTRTHEIRGHNGLAVSGRQGVNGSQAERYKHADQDRGPAQFPLVQQARQVIGLRVAGLRGQSALCLRCQARGQKNRQRKVPFHYNSPYELYSVMKQVITAQDVPAGGDLRVARGAIVTPSARELMAARGVRLFEVSQEEMPAPPPERVVALGADHGGYQLKEALKPVLRSLGLEVRDVGVHAETPADYPDIALQAAELIVAGAASRGILIDGAGIGSAIAANKIPGIRAALCYDKASARNSREHNDSNVLTLGGRLLTASQAEDVLRTWIATPFAGGRHEARVQKIREIERRYLKQTERDGAVSRPVPGVCL